VWIETHLAYLTLRICNSPAIRNAAISRYNARAVSSLALAASSLLSPAGAAAVALTADGGGVRVLPASSCWASCKRARQERAAASNRSPATSCDTCEACITVRLATERPRNSAAIFSGSACGTCGTGTCGTCGTCGVRGGGGAAGRVPAGVIGEACCTMPPCVLGAYVAVCGAASGCAGMARCCACIALMGGW